MNDNLAGVAAGNRGRRDVPVDGPVKPSRDPRGGTLSAVRAHDGVEAAKPSGAASTKPSTTAQARRCRRQWPAQPAAGTDPPP